MIEFSGVSRTFGRKRAVDHLTLKVHQGELFALLGPNGAGKTTTIKMLVGLLRPSTGTIRICNYDVAKATRETNRRLGYVPDEPYLYDKLTGREFLRFLADMYGLDDSQQAVRIAREIAAFQLEAFVDDLTESYSHGMKQRTVFAAALLHDPDVLVVDEPMIGLDPHSVRLVKDLLREKATEGVTVFMSTHTLSIAEELADRIGIVNQGKLVFVGTIDELRDRLSMHEGPLESLYLEFIRSARDEVDADDTVVEMERPSPSHTDI